jgi:serine/threonine protein kinase
LRQVLDALAYCHAPERDVVHRDIKPENIMICDSSTANADPEVKLIDFGLAAPIGEHLNEIVGTVHYLAPEAFAWGCRSAATLDIWSAGVVMHTLLTGELLPSRLRAGTDSGNAADLVRQLRPTKKGAVGHSVPNTSPAWDLLASLLREVPADRPTAAEAAKHPWLTSLGEMEDILSISPATTCTSPESPLSAWQLALAREFGQLAGRQRLLELRDRCSKLASIHNVDCQDAPQQHSYVCIDDLATSIGEFFPATSPSRSSSNACLPDCVAEALVQLGRGRTKQILRADWLVWLDAALRSNAVASASDSEIAHMFRSAALVGESCVDCWAYDSDSTRTPTDTTLGTDTEQEQL